MRAALLLLFLLVLSACGGSGGNPTPGPVRALVTSSMAPDRWLIQYSPGMPLNPAADAEGWAFAFQGPPGVHYIVQLVNGFLPQGGMAAKFKVEIDPGATLREVEPCPPNPEIPRMRFYFQRRGDDVRNAALEDWRWFTGSGTPLTNGDGTYSVEFNPALWVNVQGKTGDTRLAGWQAATQDIQAFGVTFGGCYAGHGVYVQGGKARFVMQNFTLN